MCLKRMFTLTLWLHWFICVHLVKFVHIFCILVEILSRTPFISYWDSCLKFSHHDISFFYLVCSNFVLHILSYILDKYRFRTVTSWWIEHHKIAFFSHRNDFLKKTTLILIQFFFSVSVCMEYLFLYFNHQAFCISCQTVSRK